MVDCERALLGSSAYDGRRGLHLAFHLWLGGNGFCFSGLDAFRSLILDAVDEGAHRLGGHSLCLKGIKRDFLELHPRVVIVWVQDNWHSVVEAGSKGVVLGRDDGA